MESETQEQILDLGRSLKELRQIPGVGKSIAMDLVNIGIRSVAELRGRRPEDLFDESNKFAGTVQDRCLLYVFRLAVYWAETAPEQRRPELLKWWNWKGGDCHYFFQGQRNDERKD